MGGGNVVMLHYELFQEGISQVVEVMRGECFGHFRGGRWRRPAWCGASGRRRLVGLVLRKKKVGRGPCDSERRGGAGWAVRRLRPSGEGQSGLVGEEGWWPWLGQKPELGQSSRNKILSNFIWNFNFWQTL
jgi:hypothetical protein